MDKDFKFLITLFLAWRIWLFVFLIIGWVFIPQRLHFLGGGLEHYLRFPWLWAWANFDGEHYLAIAQHGFGLGEQAFFPLYVLLMQFLVWPARGDLYFLQFSGLFISNVSFLLGLIGLWKLLSLDFKKSIVELTLVLLLLFPTSFYFGNLYTEGLFFALSVGTFYSARRGKWWIAGILAAFASGTRFLGIALLPVLLLEWWMQNRGLKQRKLKYLDVRIFGIFLAPLGLLSYMYYLQQTTGDPLNFLHSLAYFGEQRSTSPVLLPQVFWRYIKIIIDVPKNDPLFFTVILELSTAILFLAASIISFFKLRLSYVLWLFFGFIIPTFSGSFSSLPRYVLPLFPAFLLCAMFLDRQNLLTKVLVVVSLFVILGVTTTLFSRGYWMG